MQQPFLPNTVRRAATGFAALVCAVLVCAVLAVLTVLLGSGPVSAAPIPEASAPPGLAWSWPVDPPVQVARPFEPPAGLYAAGHRGVDLAARPGAEIRAAAAGTVVVAGEVAGRPVVVVAHGDARSATELRTTYQPVETTLAVGRRVVAGAVLGRLGTWAGHCPEPGCLHWGLRRGTAYLDPTALLSGPVRLLPVGGPLALEGSVGADSPVAPVVTMAIDRADAAEPATTAEPTESAASTEAGGRAEDRHGITAVRALSVGVALAVPTVVATQASMLATRRRGRWPVPRGSPP